MTKIVKLSGQDIKEMVEQIIQESKKDKKIKALNKYENITRPKKNNRVIRLTESEMIEFLDKLATKVENSRRRRNLI